MVWISVLCSLLFLTSDNAGYSAEIIRARNGELLTLTNAGIAEAGYRMTVVPSADDDELVFFRGKFSATARTWVEDVDDPDVARLAGPIPWGVVDGAVFRGAHLRPQRQLWGSGEIRRIQATTMGGIIAPIDLYLVGEREGWNKERVDQDNEFDQAHQSLWQPLMDYIREHADDLYANWDLTFDYVYTSLEDVIGIALRHGKMYRWDLRDTGQPYQPWTSMEPFETPIEGVFRILRAGPDLANLYIIDELGDIYVGFGAEHRKIGAVRDYHHPDRTLLTLLFEDQMTEKIGILHAAEDGTITIPEITWEEEGHSEDFMMELDGEETRGGIARLAEVLRQDANDARGE